VSNPNVSPDENRVFHTLQFLLATIPEGYLLSLCTKITR